MNVENSFVSSLLKVARELKKAEYVRKFREDFEKEMLSEKMDTDSQNDESNENKSTDNSKKDDPTLQLDVYDDKDYDIEEVKFWNFISKNKGVKPSIVRTVVYKYPESSYVVKKTPVYLPKPEKNESEKKDSEMNIVSNKEIDTNTEVIKPTKTTNEIKQATTASELSVNMNQVRKVGRPKGSNSGTRNNIESTKSNLSKPEVIVSTTQSKAVDSTQSPINKTEKLSVNDSTSLNELLKSSKATIINDSTKEKLAAQSSGHFVSKNYKMEDLIMIDEDDDIIGYNESDEENDLAEAQQNTIEATDSLDNNKTETIEIFENNDKKQSSDNESKNNEIYELDVSISDDDTCNNTEKIEETDSENQVQTELTEEITSKKIARVTRAKSNRSNKEELLRNNKIISNNKEFRKVKTAPENPSNFISKRNLISCKQSKNEKTEQCQQLSDAANNVITTKEGRTVSRVTRSKTKLGNNQFVHSPASST